jgi:hypothetical protein
MTSNAADSGHLPLMTTLRCFERSVVDLGRLGLSGTGLIVAAEHMAGSRLRAYDSSSGDSQ